MQQKIKPSFSFSSSSWREISKGNDDDDRCVMLVGGSSSPFGWHVSVYDVRWLN
jgi:hypothetical protein